MEGAPGDKAVVQQQPVSISGLQQPVSISGVVLQVPEIPINIFPTALFPPTEVCGSTWTAKAVPIKMNFAPKGIPIGPSDDAC